MVCSSALAAESAATSPISSVHAYSSKPSAQPTRDRVAVGMAVLPELLELAPVADDDVAHAFEARRRGLSFGLKALAELVRLDVAAVDVRPRAPPYFASMNTFANSLAVAMVLNALAAFAARLPTSGTPRRSPATSASDLMNPRMSN